MEASQWTLIIALIGSGAATLFGVLSLKQGERSKYTFLFMLAAFVAQCFFLYFRGELRGKCPLGDWGEISVFIAWSLSIFYMVIGPAYRISLLGFFSAPLVSSLCLLALIPGVLETNPTPLEKGKLDPWSEMHAALSVMSYGALALATVASVMFLLLDKKLKAQELKGGLFDNLPPVFQLIAVTKRLLWVGLGILTVGILSSLKMKNVMEHLPHLWAALGVWGAYLVYLLWGQIKGMTPRTFAKICCLLFVLSLAIFAKL